MKHVGKMKNNGARIVVAYRTLPGDPYSALVIGTGNLGESYHDSLMNLVQDTSAQQANELADILAVRKFPDGSTMLHWLHTYGHLKKVPTNLVIMTPTRNDNVQLDELNLIIAEQKGISLDDLAVNDGTADSRKNPRKPAKPEVSQDIEVDVSSMSPAQLRSKADSLFKEAQILRKQADLIDPPKRKKKDLVEVEE